MENTNMTTEELQDMVANNSEIVIEAAEQYVPRINWMGGLKTCGKVGIAGLMIYGGYKLVKDVIIPAAQAKKPENETVDCGSRDYTEAIDESEVAGEDEE